MKEETKLLRLFHAKQRPNSVNGCPRWKFSARTASGDMWEFKTASDVSSSYSCNLSRLKPSTVIRVRFHETATGALMADSWDDGRSSGIDLDSQFAELEMACDLQAGLRDPRTSSTPVRL